MTVRTPPKQNHTYGPTSPSIAQTKLQLPSLPYKQRASTLPRLLTFYNDDNSSLSPSPPPSDTMAGPVRTAPQDRLAQPPRPPNAWILYRSDKIRELPPTQPGNPRRAQAEVSKMISSMWRNESDAVRAEYERRADAKKAEHQAMYPGYRFQPMKKEEKERLREEKRVERERERAQSRRGRVRPVPYAMPFSAPQAGYAVPIYDPQVRYGPAGPSPPLSAASSPSGASPYPESHADLPRHQASQSSTHPSPNTDSYLGSSQETAASSPAPQALYSSFMSAAQTPSHTPSVNLPPLPAVEHTVWQHLPQQEQNSNDVLTPVETPNWQDSSNTSQLTFDGGSQDDNVTFNIPNFGDTGMPLWPTDDSGFDFQAFATGDPSVYQLSGFDLQSLLVQPEGEIEVSMGSQMTQYDPQSLQDLDLAASLFNNFNFDFPFTGESLSQTTDNVSIDPAQTISPSQLDANSSSSSPHHTRNFSSFGSDNSMLQYINLDDLSSVNQEAGPSRPAPPPHSQSMPLLNHGFDSSSSNLQRQPYIPPSGAANSSTRRVAASWKPTFTAPPASPIEHSTTTPWGVPTG